MGQRLNGSAPPPPASQRGQPQRGRKAALALTILTAASACTVARGEPIHSTTFRNLSAGGPQPTVAFHRCYNFQDSYAGAYLVSTDLFLRVNFRDMNALEWASREVWTLTMGFERGRVAGCVFKTIDRKAFYILHLSGSEHGFVRRVGYAKGMQFTTTITQTALHEVNNRHLRPEGLLRPWLPNVLSLVPFYGGSGVVSLNPEDMHKPKFDAKVGNSHTLASPELKVMQLLAVVCSNLEYFETVIVGVCRQEDLVAIEKTVNSEAVGFLCDRCRSGFRVKVFNCADGPLYLPYVLLRWAQDNFHNPHSEWFKRFSGVYYTEADNVLRMDGVTTEGMNEVMKQQRFRCYFAPQRMERRTHTKLDEPFEELSVSGQNACAQGLEYTESFL
uniref:Uncharacterized protein n=1 Tax=Rhizochromulina marina TaxID=1034831 RepID=A0A7S2REH0_9STRA|mmetsp:Transcript_15135/g.44771  ORF Transcript_15135/g.44771 Transcript_15135/m.44771 type:complete len:388 (+) Transcript_15135:77-1240(+)